MKTKSSVINRFRFQVGNGVTHPKFGNGIVEWETSDGYGVRFENGKLEMVPESPDLVSNPKGALYRKSNRQLCQDACYEAARKRKAAAKKKSTK